MSGSNKEDDNQKIGKSSELEERQRQSKGRAEGRRKSKTREKEGAKD